MNTLTITLNATEMRFVYDHSRYGYATENAIVTEALHRLKESLEQTALEESALLYAEEYASDADLRELTDAALQGFP
jgi:hypothetical protein